MAKSIESLFEEISASEEMKKEFVEALQKKEDIKSFLEKHECEASLQEAKEFIEARAQEGELTPEELEQAAGGTDIFIGVLGSLAGIAISAMIGKVIQLDIEAAQNGTGC